MAVREGRHENPISRRSLLQAGLAASATGVCAPMLSACGGFGTSGGGKGTVFFSTQFKPVEEGERFRKILGKAGGDAQYVTADPGQFAARLNAELRAGKPTVNLIGGLYGELAPFAPDRLEDLSDVAASLAGRGYAKESLELAKFGTGKTYFIPWMQATYIVAVNKKALATLPSGANVAKLTYDQYLAWAKAAKAKAGKPVFGLPAGPNSLLHRLFQGYLYPSFTGGQVTTFGGDAAVAMWQYVRELWSYTAPASTNYDFMQEPLASGEVQVAWDHVTRLVDAPKDAPNDFLMVPAPTGPKGRGYMPVLAGLAIPKGAKRQAESKKLIEALARPDIQLDVLRNNAFFPTVKAAIPGDLQPGVRLEAGAVSMQENSSDALLSLPPVGLGSKEAEVSALYRNAFKSIVLDGKDIRSTLNSQAGDLQDLLNESKAPCWKPDPDSAGKICQVGR